MSNCLKYKLVRLQRGGAAKPMWKLSMEYAKNDNTTYLTNKIEVLMMYYDRMSNKLQARQRNGKTGHESEKLFKIDKNRLSNHKIIIQKKIDNITHLLQYYNNSTVMDQITPEFLIKYYKKIGKEKTEPAIEVLIKQKGNPTIIVAELIMKYGRSPLVDTDIPVMINSDDINLQILLNQQETEQTGLITMIMASQENVPPSVAADARALVARALAAAAAAAAAVAAAPAAAPAPAGAAAAAPAPAAAAAPAATAAPAAPAAADQLGGNSDQLSSDLSDDFVSSQEGDIHSVYSDIQY